MSTNTSVGPSFVLSWLVASACGGDAASENATGTASTAGTDGTASTQGADTTATSTSEVATGAIDTTLDGDAGESGEPGDSTGGSSPLSGTRIVYTSIDRTYQVSFWQLTYEEGTIDGPHLLAEMPGASPPGRWFLEQPAPGGRAIAVLDSAIGEVAHAGLLFTDPNLAGGDIVVMDEDPAMPQLAASDRGEFTGDGEGFVYRAHSSDPSPWSALYYVPIGRSEIGGPIAIVGPTESSALTFTLTPTGDRIAVLGDVDRDGTAETYLAAASPAPTGELVPLAPAGASLGEFGPNGDVYAYLGGPPGEEQVFLRGLRGLEIGDPIAVEGPGGAQPALSHALSPDGSSIAWQGGEGDLRRLYVAPLVGAVPGRSSLASPPELPSSQQPMQWSSDGRWLAAFALEGGLVVRPHLTRVASGVAGPVTLFEPENDGGVTFSPDGSAAWLEHRIDSNDDEVWRVDLSGETPGVPAPIDPSIGMFGDIDRVLHTSASGRHLVFRTSLDDNTLFHVDNATAPLDAVVIPGVKPDLYERFRITPNEEAVVYRQGEGTAAYLAMRSFAEPDVEIQLSLGHGVSQFEVLPDR